jgi:large subunit ribosomal protein L4e
MAESAKEKTKSKTKTQTTKKEQKQKQKKTQPSTPKKSAVSAQTKKNQTKTTAKAKDKKKVIKDKAKPKEKAKTQPKLKHKAKPKASKTKKKADKKLGTKSKSKTTEEKPKAKKEVQFIPGAKEVNLYSIKGKSTKKIKLPIAFDEAYRLDLIRRAVKAARANRRQPYGPALDSGMKHSTSTWGKGRGAARVQRLVDGRRAVESPNNVGGRRAHPPKVEKIWAEKLNKKERKKARRAALAAITDSDLVKTRGHKFDKKITLPLIMEDKFEEVQKTKEALDIFQKIGIYDDIMRALNGKHIRAGKGKGRGRVFRRPKSVLIIATEQNEIRKGVHNLIGIDVVTPDNLSIEDLAPGGDPGRLTIITESALKMMGSW